MQFEILVWLLVKHFICDFPLQAHPWLYSRKGYYGSPGGLVHAAIHGIGTAVVLAFFPLSGEVILWASVADIAAHYHIDFAKMRLNRAFGWGPTTSEWFWMLVGLDQLAHHLTYAAIAFAVVI